MRVQGLFIFLMLVVVPLIALSSTWGMGASSYSIVPNVAIPLPTVTTTTTRLISETRVSTTTVTSIGPAGSGPTVTQTSTLIIIQQPTGVTGAASTTTTITTFTGASGSVTVTQTQTGTVTATTTSVSTSTAGLVPGLDPSLNIPVQVTVFIIGVLIGALILWVKQRGKASTHHIPCHPSGDEPGCNPSDRTECQPYKDMCEPERSCAPDATCRPCVPLGPSSGRESCKPAEGVEVCGPNTPAGCGPRPASSGREIVSRRCSACGIYKVVGTNCAGCGNVEHKCVCGKPASNNSASEREACRPGKATEDCAPEGCHPRVSH